MVVAEIAISQKLLLRGNNCTHVSFDKVFDLTFDGNSKTMAFYVYLELCVFRL